MPKVICPKCSREGWLIKKKLKGNWYLYVDHYVYDQEKFVGKHIVHYLGPARKFPELAEMVGLEAVSSRDQDNATNLLPACSRLLLTELVAIPRYDEFMDKS